jgi:hypothetical protein
VPASAEDANEPISVSDVEVDVSILISELDELRSEVEQLKSAERGRRQFFPHRSDNCRGGWFAGAEITIVKPYFGNGFYHVEGFPTWTDDFSTYSAPRVFLGSRSADGLGLQATFWHFDHTSDDVVYRRGNSYTRTRRMGLKAQALDLEATKFSYCCGVHWDLGAGLRYGQVGGLFDDSEVFSGRPATYTYLFDSTFEGLGPSMALRGRHQFGTSRFSVISNFRTAVLFGNQDLEFRLIDSDQSVSRRPGRNDSRLVPILEQQVGVEWTILVRSARFSIRCMVEGQWWGNAIIEEPEDLIFPRDAEDLGFFGGTLSTSCMW